MSLRRTSESLRVASEFHRFTHVFLTFLGDSLCGVAFVLCCFLVGLFVWFWFLFEGFPTLLRSRSFFSNLDRQSCNGERGNGAKKKLSLFVFFALQGICRLRVLAYVEINTAISVNRFQIKLTSLLIDNFLDRLLCQDNLRDQ